MEVPFIAIYHFFRKHKAVFYTVLTALFAVSAFFASKVRFEENINSFLPDDGDSRLAVEVFDNLTVKDKIVIMLSDAEDRGSLISASDSIESRLADSPAAPLIKGIMSEVNSSVVKETGDFIYSHLPVFLDSADYARIDSLTVSSAIRDRMKSNFMNLILPSGFAVKEHILRDPLGIASGTLASLKDFQVESDYLVADNHIFSKDGSTLIMLISPVYSTGSTGMNEPLVSALEDVLESVRTDFRNMDIEYFGGPSVGVYNARQIKKDTYLTSAVALLIIILFIFIAFKSKKSIPLIIVPALFGALFSLALIYFIQGSISAIAVGAGSAVLGIALSYSIHVLAHQNHVSSVEQLLKELVYPLTVGSFTTIGAFLGLLFTSSQLLQDFGLFASLALIGTTLFCLVFLPQFLSGHADAGQGKILSAIERLNSIHFEKNRILVGGLAVLAAVCAVTSGKVSFEDDLSGINYEPRHIRQAEEKLMSLTEGSTQNILFVSTGRSTEDASEQYSATDSLLSVMLAEGKIEDWSSARSFIIPEDEQLRRIGMWNEYWTKARKDRVKSMVETAAEEAGFRPGAFAGFNEMLDRNYGIADYSSGAVSSLFENWYAASDSLVMLISNVRIDETFKQEVYDAFAAEPETVIFDRAYFVKKWVSAVNDDFYLVLYISSILIFFALWLSYGRLELALMSFLPMFISWIIIIGIMGIFGMKFNIINIILSTFIFGIGDDFSIFIMDGLISKYKYGRDLLGHHKTAIFFSAFTILVGIGALIFAVHPALKSIAVISIFGIIAVVLVAYVLQPILFRIFISGPVSDGCPPVTISGIIRTALLFGLFSAGCVLTSSLIFPLYLVPVSRKRKGLWISYIMHYTSRMIIASAFALRKVRENAPGEDFRRPGIIIANHQSFLDILMMLSISPKMIMVTNNWVWNSPLFGRMIKYSGFVCTDAGYEYALGHIREKLEEGYCIVIFPEGTRSADGVIRRFHNGAFYIAEKTGADIIPVLLYGNWRAIPKNRPYYIRKSTIGYKVLPRIRQDDTSFGSAFNDRTRSVCRYMRSEYAAFCREQDNAGNPYFRDSLISAYIYKGPVTEWYMRIKLRMEDYYARFDAILPRSGQITDIGCGMGALCEMMSMLSPDRKVTGIDYDEDKIAVAANIRIAGTNTEYICADAASSSLPASDAFILNDMLHYLSPDAQDRLVAACAANLAPGGMIVIRDGDSGKEQRHRLTRLTEVFSTRILKFNKTNGRLHFLSGERIRSMAAVNGLSVQEMQNDRYTSNTIYILKQLP